MLDDLVRSLTTLTCSTDSIQASSSSLSAHLTQTPSDSFPFVCLWLKTLESHPNKIALLYLANELLQTNRCESLSKCFEQVMPDAFRLMGGAKLVNAEMRRVLMVWRQRGVFPGEFVDMLSKICDGIEAVAQTEAGNAGQLAKLALFIDQLEQFKANKGTLAGSELAAAEEKEKAVREEYILELAKMIKRLNVQLTNHCIYLQQLNAKCDELAEVS